LQEFYFFVEKDSESWLASFLQMHGYCMQKTKALTRNRIAFQVWIELFQITESRAHYNYFNLTIVRQMFRLGTKYLQLGMIDEAL